MAESESRDRAASRPVALVLWLASGLALRASAAVVVDRLARRKGAICLFPDAEMYWFLARQIRQGGAFVVQQFGIPHYALRTPGYPVVLAGCQAIFGDPNTLAVRLMQAVLGVLGAWFLYRIVRRIRPEAALAAAALASVEPYTAGMSALILSEAVFVPLMLLALWGLATLWIGPDQAGPKRPRLVALGTGLAAGSAILVRPSWALFVPAALGAWVVLAGKGARRGAFRRSAVVAVGVVLVMGPWWLRNAELFGRFVPTALWSGASLYDGLRPEADGASDMRFLGRAEFRALSEEAQDAELRARAFDFARRNPRRALQLAAIKAGRFWSPWPNTETIRAPGALYVSAAITLPVFALMLLGAWDRRRDPRALVLLAGPLLYFAALHMVFVGSIRYRIPAEVPALGLAALGAVRLAGRRSARLANQAGGGGDHPPRRRGVGKLLLWGSTFLASVLAGALIAAYCYVTDSETLATLIRDEAPRYFPGSSLEVFRVQLRPWIGEVDLKNVTLRQAIDGQSFAAVRLPWLHISCDLRAFWRHGKLEPRRVVVVQPTLRLQRRADGRWNLQGLLADPWPVASTVRPVVLISRGVVELVDGNDPATILHDVELRIEPRGDGAYHFVGSAQGDAIERLDLEGTFDPQTGRLVLTRGNLAGLTISDSWRQRLPAEVHPLSQRIGLTGGLLDVSLAGLSYDPAAVPATRYALHLSLRSGTWDCPKFPFPLNNVAADAAVRDGTLTIERAEGQYGNTIVRAHGTLDAEGPETGPLSLAVQVVDLELNARLRAKLPPDLTRLWGEFAPPGRPDLGRVHLAANLSRSRPGAPIRFGLTAEALDVAIQYFQFPYPLEHIRGKLRWQGSTIHLDLATDVGSKPLTCKGTIENPGPNAVVRLNFAADAMPINETLLKALPRDARPVVEQFHPTGSVRGTAKLVRVPEPGGDPRGKVRVDTVLDLNEHCSMVWDGLPYPVQDLTGHLELHPESWVFRDMSGRNGMARINARGRVDQRAPGRLAVDLNLSAEHLPFNNQLRQALPPEWRASWEILNPVGSSTVAARILADPDRPERNQTLLNIRPEEATRVRLKLTPVPGTTGDLGVIWLPPMDDVTGRFVFHNGTVTLSDVDFNFHGAPVHIKSGTVIVRDNGQFTIGTTDLEVRRLRLDAELRKIMPPLMAQFAQRLDNGQPYTARGDLGIAWSGRAGDPAVCTWKRGLVILNDNAIQTGMPLEHLQGQVSSIRGRSDGRTLDVLGVLELASVKLFDLQVTDLSSPLVVGGGQAMLSDIRGRLLDGEVSGRVGVRLDATPRYEAHLRLRAANLESYTQTLRGHQDYRGLVNAAIDFEGLGGNLRSLQGKGEAHLIDGDLGKMPPFLKLLAPLNFSREKAVFDRADLNFTIRDGLWALKPIKFTGNVFSLYGHGTIDPLGHLDLEFSPLYGRDELLHVRGLSDVLREFKGQLFVIKVRGSINSYKFRLAPLPLPARRADALLRRLGDRRRDPADPILRP